MEKQQVLRIMHISTDLAGADFIVYAHNIEYRRFQSLGRWRYVVIYLLEKLVFRLADLVLFVSMVDLNTARNDLKLNQNISAIPGGQFLFSLVFSYYRLDSSSYQQTILYH